MSNISKEDAEEGETSSTTLGTWKEQPDDAQSIFLPLNVNKRSLMREREKEKEGGREGAGESAVQPRG